MKTLKLPPMLDLLLKTRERISDIDNWCQGHLEREDKRCLIGAVIYENHPATTDVLHLLQRIVGHIADFNDSHTHAEVLAALDKAICRCPM